MRSAQASGHFADYAFLSGLVFLARNRTSRDRSGRPRQRNKASLLQEPWQSNGAVVGLLFTLSTTSLDEIHHTFLASGRGRWQDVIVDISGALLLQLVLYTWFRRRVGRLCQTVTRELEPFLIREPWLRS